MIDQLFGVEIDAVGFSENAPIFDLDVLAVDPAQLRKPLGQRDGLTLALRIVLRPPGQHADPARLLGRLRERFPRSRNPCQYGTTKGGDYRAPVDMR